MHDQVEGAGEELGFEIVRPEGFGVEGGEGGGFVAVAQHGDGVGRVGVLRVVGEEGAVHDGDLVLGEGGGAGADVEGLGGWLRGGGEG